MKKKLCVRSIFAACLFLANFTFVAAGQNSINQIESGFRRIPDSIQTSVYWYWMSDNISKEGVVKDLEAMKHEGINRAFIGCIGGQNVPYGKVKMFSDEWWEILHTALKKASELNIEIGIFNSPGWSQSGGPWVKAEQAMRYLKLIETQIKGGSNVSIKAEPKSDMFQPVSVLAYKKKATKLNSAFEISTADLKNQTAILTDNNIQTAVKLQVKKEQSFIFIADKAELIRSLKIQTSEEKIKAKAALFVETANGFRLLKEFEIDRSRAALNVGFIPYAPIVIAVPETKSNKFKLTLTNVSLGGGISEMELSSKAYVERYPEKSLAKMFQNPLPYWHEYMWNREPEVSDKNAVISEKDVIDITSAIQPDGTIKWKVPAGDWVIVQTGMCPTGVENGPASPEATGYETDKMSKEHIRSHFNAYLGEIMRRIPAADRRTWKVVVQDSYEMGGQNWTEKMMTEFKSRYGYDAKPYLLTLNGHVVGSRDKSDRFLWDLRRLIADKVANDYVAGLRDVSHENGLTTWLENYGHWGFPSEFLLYGKNSDEIGGEFWSEGSLGNIENRAASSCAHIYGKTKVSAESFTCGGKAFSRHPANMKPRGDRFFTEGINNTLLHLFIQQPDEREPGINAPFGNEFNRHNTWFVYMDLFVGYLKRTNFMLQQGKYVADVAYFIGEDAPKMTGVCNPPLPKGYSFDYINADVIMNRISVKNGELVLPDGMKYKMLVLPKQNTMRPELLQKIAELVHRGAVVLGEPPLYSPSLANFPAADKQVGKIAGKLWKKVDGKQVKWAKAGDGMILRGMEMQEALSLIGSVPDFKVDNQDSVLFIHRTTGEAEIYFISNQTNKTINIKPEFRVTGKKTELWNPVSVSVRQLPEYSLNEKTTTVPLKMEAFESQFVVFRNSSEKPSTPTWSTNFPEGKLLADISENWTVSFDTAKRGPKNPVLFKTLTDLTLSSNDSIKYFSGMAVYSKNVTINKPGSGKSIFLNVGNLTSMAKIKVNGKSVGGVWTAPWQLDISSALKEGDNLIEISVVNNWMNRLIGDQKIPVENRPTWTITMPYKADTPLQSSGLFGPVRILEIN